MKTFHKELNAYLEKIFSVDVRSLALFRISFGLVMLVDLIDRLRFLQTFYTDSGTVPRHAITEFYQYSYQFSLHMIAGDAFFMSLMFGLHIFFILMFIFGIKSRWATFFCWLFCISLNNRNPGVIFGGDVVVRVILFWSMFVPLGLHYSVDSALNKVKYKAKTFFNAGVVALMLQLLFVYFFSGLHKQHPQWMVDGTALAYALELDQFATPFGIWLRQFPLLLKVLTYATFVLELFGPIVLLLPHCREKIRLFGVLAFCGLHIGIFLTMNVGLFPWMCMSVWMIFLPSSFWDYIVRRITLHRAEGAVIYYDEDCGFCKKGVYILKELLVLSKISIEPAQGNSKINKVMLEENSWVVQKSYHGDLHTKYQAFLALVSMSPFARIFTFMFSFYPIRKIGEFLYHVVSHNRKKVSLLTQRLEWSDYTYKPFAMTKWVVFLLMSYVLLYNLGGIEWSNKKYEKIIHEPYSLYPIRRILRIDQEWSMFAPYPTTADGWYVMHGKTKEGKDVNLWNTDYKNPYKQPDNVSATFINHRWRKYLRNIRLGKHEKYRKYLGRYLCRKTNKHRKGDNRLDVLKIKYMYAKTSLGEPYPVEEHTIWTHYCFSKPSDANKIFAIVH